MVLAALAVFAILLALAPGQVAESLWFMLWSLWGISGAGGICVRGALAAFVRSRLRAQPARQLLEERVALAL